MREGVINRKTNETDIRLKLELDGSGKSCIDTGCGFLDHMLTLFARHGRFDLTISCKGAMGMWRWITTTRLRISASRSATPSRRRSAICGA